MAFRFTLVADGESDRALVPVIQWVIQKISRIAIAGFTVEFTTGQAGESPYEGLARKIDSALREFPCDLLFVHRDAESQSPERRRAEIATAITAVGARPLVPIVPVKMTEAWLLIDELAIRKAADNPKGRANIELPLLRRLEELADPKTVCDELLVKASEKSGRRRTKFSRPSELAWRRVRLAQLIADFSPLLNLPAFREFHAAAFDECGRLCGASA